MLRLIKRFKLTDNPRADILSGLTVALALVPEAIAFAFVAHVEPLVGLYAAFFMALITAVFGGRSGMISGATGAMAVVMVALVITHGVEYLFAAVVLTGLIQMLAGTFHLGKFIRLVPHSVMLGFVNGLAIVIFLAQLGQFKTPVEESVEHTSAAASGTAEAGHHSAIDVVFNGGWMQGQALYMMLGLTALTMFIIWGLPKLGKAAKLVPSSLVAIIAVSGLVIGLDMDTRTVGDMASVSGGLPQFHIPMVPFTIETLWIILPFSITLAAVGLIESLLTLTLIDEITNTRGRTSMECWGQGLGNLVSGFFGSMGGCAMIGQSMINIESGGRGRLSGITAAVFLMIFIVFTSTWIEMIPLAALTGLMFIVVISTFAWASLRIMHKIPHQDAFVIILVTGVTVAYDLALAVIVGVIVSALVYAWKSAQHLWVEKAHSPDNAHKVYKLHGSVFFGSISQFKELFNPENDKEAKDVVIDFAAARVWDHSALEAIDSLADKYQNAGITLHLVHLSPDCQLLLKKARDLVQVSTIEDPNYRVFTDYTARAEEA